MLFTLIQAYSSYQLIKCLCILFHTAMLLQIMQLFVQGLHIIERQKLVSHFLLHLAPILDLSFTPPNSLNLVLFPPGWSSPSQLDRDQFHLLGIWYLMEIKDSFHLVKPIHEFFMIQATIELRQLNLEFWFPFWFSPWRTRNLPWNTCSRMTNWVTKVVWLSVLASSVGSSSFLGW